jgi:hypothetical protein
VGGGILGILLVGLTLGVWSWVGSARRWSTVRTLVAIAITLGVLVLAAVGALIWVSVEGPA